ncbi:hypothetical protein VT84_35525 [Gemmata sp. SH-PL17]|uniref:hypothetical protein n=1 Tax=Gemmata sp. SH-PL17 TaxID=1630693 RepID=UPI0004B98FE8|nr:hypothetical protein [Gemmata sp. SH-PL17]AMV29758.1 hypothetical protein VT84_35525 [Gemmata sp. SH-PL17]
MSAPQFRVLLSEAVKDQLRDVVARAAARGQRTEALAAARKILDGLTWIADEFGESRGALKVMGELRVAIIGPIGVVFAVDRAKWEVHIGRFRLMGARRFPGST